MHNPILQFVQEQADSGLHPSAVAVEHIDGCWQCRVAFSGLYNTRELNSPVSVDTTDLPAGISVTQLVAWPDAVMPLETPDRDDIERWINEVARVGNAPNWAWIGNHKCLTRPIEWLREPMRTALLREHGKL